MVVDVVVEMDDIDMMLARIEMARDKLTTGRIARSVVQAKGKPKMALTISRKSKCCANSEAKRAAGTGCKNTTCNRYSENCSPLSHRKYSR
jgi:hypothetical protein